jgi:hypothetical protein
MSETTKNVPGHPEVTTPENQPAQIIPAVLKNLKTRNLNGVRFHRLTGLGPMTVHSTESSKNNPEE